MKNKQSSVDDFLDLSSLLTGFDKVDLQGTGLAEIYRKEVLGIIGAQITTEIEKAGTAIYRKYRNREKLMEEANMVPYEQVEIYDVNNGERFSTYIIKGKRNSGTICLNGAAARKVAKGDLVIIVTYVAVDDAEAKTWKPKCVLVDAKNKIKKVSK